MPYFAAEMKTKLLFIMLVFLSMKGSIMAQHRMYICRFGLADAYEVSCMAQLEMKTDSFRIRQQPAYDIEEVDSIVFHSPELPVRELGWWGDLSEGQSLYKAQLRMAADVLDLYGYPHHEFEPFDYDVLFIIEAESGICQTVRCELHFSEEWMSQIYLYLIEEQCDSSSGQDPYIYVKETGTGPRRFETWVSNDPVLPIESTWHREGTMLWSDCTELLSGRPIEDVQEIIEAWVHQQPKKINKPDSNNNP